MYTLKRNTDGIVIIHSKTHRPVAKFFIHENDGNNLKKATLLAESTIGKSLLLRDIVYSAVKEAKESDISFSQWKKKYGFKQSSFVPDWAKLI